MPRSVRRQAGLHEKVRSGEVTISVIGLGRVGLPFSVAFANAGLRVIGVDSDARYVSRIRAGEVPFKETRFSGLLKAALASGKFSATADAIEAVEQSDVVVVAVGTPVTERNNVDYSQIRKVLSSLAKAGLKGKAVGFRSTLGPGTTQELIIPYLEGSTGLKVGSDFFLAVCPERILEGKAIEELHNLPEIVGALDSESRAIFSSLFKRLNGQKEIRFLSPTAAELAKLYANVYRYANFALANEFAVWAERYGEDAVEVIRTTNHGYPRSNIPLPGFAGGPCLAKDGLFLDNSTTFSSMISAAWKLNEAIPQHVANSVKEALGGTLYAKRIGVLGVAYKAGIDDTRLSPALKLVEILTEQGAQVEVHDPYVKKNVMPLSRVTKGKDCIILAVNHPDYLERKEEIARSRPRVFYDVWGVFDKDEFSGTAYMGFGRRA